MEEEIKRAEDIWFYLFILIDFRKINIENIIKIQKTFLSTTDSVCRSQSY